MSPKKTASSHRHPHFDEDDQRAMLIAAAIIFAGDRRPPDDPRGRYSADQAEEIAVAVLTAIQQHTRR